MCNRMRVRLCVFDLCCVSSHKYEFPVAFTFNLHWKLSQFSIKMSSFALRVRTLAHTLAHRSQHSMRVARKKRTLRSSSRCAHWIRCPLRYISSAIYALNTTYAQCVQKNCRNISPFKFDSHECYSCFRVYADCLFALFLFSLLLLFLLLLLLKSSNSDSSLFKWNQIHYYVNA